MRYRFMGYGIDGAEIRRRRLARALSQEELADALKELARSRDPRHPHLDFDPVATVTVRRWETGRATPTESHLVALARVLDCRTDDLRGRISVSVVPLTPQNRGGGTSTSSGLSGFCARRTRCIFTDLALDVYDMAYALRCDAAHAAAVYHGTAAPTIVDIDRILDRINEQWAAHPEYEENPVTMDQFLRTRREDRLPDPLARTLVAETKAENARASRRPAEG